MELQKAIFEGNGHVLVGCIIAEGIGERCGDYLIRDEDDDGDFWCNGDYVTFE